MTEGPAADLMARTGDTRQRNDMLKQAINSNVSQRSGSEVSWSSFCRFFWLDKCVPTWLKKLTCNPSSAKGSGDARPVMEPDSVVGPEVETMVWIRLCLFATALLHIDRLQ